MTDVLCTFCCVVDDAWSRPGHGLMLRPCQTKAASGFALMCSARSEGRLYMTEMLCIWYGCCISNCKAVHAGAVMDDRLHQRHGTCQSAVLIDWTPLLGQHYSATLRIPDQYRVLLVSTARAALRPLAQTSGAHFPRFMSAQSGESIRNPSVRASKTLAVQTMANAHTWDCCVQSLRFVCRFVLTVIINTCEPLS